MYEKTQNGENAMRSMQKHDVSQRSECFASNCESGPITAHYMLATNAPAVRKLCPERRTIAGGDQLHGRVHKMQISRQQAVSISNSSQP